MATPRNSWSTPCDPNTDCYLVDGRAIPVMNEAQLRAAALAKLHRSMENVFNAITRKASP